MKQSLGAAFSSIASAVLVVVLLAAFLGESARDVMLYYGFNTVNPLLGGVFAIGVIAVYAAVRAGRLSEPVGTGIALGLGLISFLVVTTWTVTRRVDVFQASGWAFPAQGPVLVGVAALIVLGTSLRAWRLGLFPVGRDQSR